MKTLDNFETIEQTKSESDQAPNSTKFKTFLGELAINARDVLPAESEVSDDDLSPRTRTHMGSGNYDSD